VTFIFRDKFKTPALLPHQNRHVALESSNSILRHVNAAAMWIMTAWKNSLDGGIPAYYDLIRRRWCLSYPETTGYIIPTLHACSVSLHKPYLSELAVDLANWLLSVRTIEGGVRPWNDTQGAPVIFDTGQVIFGWLAAFRQTADQTYIQAAMDAANWLGNVQSENGAWDRYQHEGTVKVIDTRVAWALLALEEQTGGHQLSYVADRNLEWALSKQLPNGWFQNAAFKPGECASTHALTYTAEGLLESGILLGETRYIKAAERTALALLEGQRRDGSLAWKYDSNWRPITLSSCLTGDCQAALLWLRLYGLNNEPRLLEAARRAIAFVAKTQVLNEGLTDVSGGIAGSYPIYLGYARFRYPNWAAKFFIDSLLALMHINVPVNSIEKWYG
jgi:hypothetical protein